MANSLSKIFEMWFEGVIPVNGVPLRVWQISSHVAWSSGRSLQSGLLLRFSSSIYGREQRRHANTGPSRMRVLSAPIAPAGIVLCVMSVVSFVALVWPGSDLARVRAASGCGCVSGAGFLLGAFAFFLLLLNLGFFVFTVLFYLD